MQAVLMVNSECNVKCEHCYLPYTGARSPENALETVKKLQNNGHSVIVAGSETLLNPDYLKAYQQAGQKHLLSNGIRLDKDPSLYDKLKEYGIERLEFSMHFGIQDKLNSVPEARVARVVSESKKRGFNVKVTPTITSSNYSAVMGMCEKAVEYGADSIQFNRLVKIGKGRSMGTEALSEGQIREFFSYIGEARERHPKSVLEIRPHGDFGPRPGSKGEKMAGENRYCSAGIDLVAIDPQDRVYGCPFSMGLENVIGYHEEGKVVIEKDLLGGKRDTCIAHILAEK